MKLIFFVLTVAGLAWPIEMAPSEEFEKELTLLRMKIENLEKNDTELEGLKKKIKEIEINEEKMNESIVQMSYKISSMEKNEISISKKLANLENTKENLNKGEEMKIAKKVPLNNLNKIENSKDHNDEVRIFFSGDIGTESDLEGKIWNHEDTDDCCDILTEEINEIKDYIGHFNDRLNNNTAKIVENKLAIQNNNKNIDTNTDNIDANANQITINTNNLNDAIQHIIERVNDNTLKIVENQFEIQNSKEQIDTNTNNIDANANEIVTNANNVGNLMKESDYCAWKGSTNQQNQVITYDKLLLSNNYNIPGAQMDIGKGVFTAGRDGTYQIGVTVRWHRTGSNMIYLRRNGQNVAESRMQIYKSSHHEDFGGRYMMLRLQHGDTVEVFNQEFSGESINDITFCINLLK